MRFVVALVVTFSTLLGAWEAVLRGRASTSIDAMNRPPSTASIGTGEEWLIFGNCLVMTGISPRSLKEQFADDRARVIRNIAWHEQSPIAFFDYLRQANHYPDVVIANVSSWLNGTNFEQEGALLAQRDPLGIAPSRLPEGGRVGRDQAYRGSAELGHGDAQRAIEESLSRWAAGHMTAVGHRYHLFDYALFLGTLATTVDLDRALYQLNMQSWFRVVESDTDGLGFLGLRVSYRADWSTGLDVMAQRSLQRLRLSNALSATYWTLLEENARVFRGRGTQVIFVRMPEHPRIREFNDATYRINEKMRGLGERTGALYLDLSRLGPDDGVRLFDAVHPDAPAAAVITREVGRWLRAHPSPGHVTTRQSVSDGG